MIKDKIYSGLDLLRESIEGDLRYDEISRTIYSTDASVYKELPLAVIWPKGTSDLKKIILFAAREKISLTPRAAGTSLAGQVVGGGIIVDVSKYMNMIIEVNAEEMWVRVEPGVVLDELNMHLKPYNLFFGPETSTSNRCNLGGMVGNNACGSHSLVYGSTREHTLELKVVLSDCSEVTFGSLDKQAFQEKCRLPDLEGDIYRNIFEILSDPLIRKQIKDGYPDPLIPRRNTGYALDLLIDNAVFNEGSDEMFNFCRLLTGSEGTLAFITEIKLNLVRQPSPHKALVCIHLRKRNEAFLANLIALRYGPAAVEMMDDKILELTVDNISQMNNRFFLSGNPSAIVIVEFAEQSMEETESRAERMISELKSAGYGYAYPVVKGKDISRVWELRKAGLGILSNMKGDAKPVSLIEDAAFRVEQMPGYIADFEKLLSKYNKEVVYHAHIGSGELHMRPVLNLKDKEDVKLFRTLGQETAQLVKKYRGSMSGEHGDGRLRSEFIPVIIGEDNYELLKKIKQCWDPGNILNPGKIVNAPVMNTGLRYAAGRDTPEIETVFDFSSSGGLIRAAEKCNGVADCRKSHIIGGTMCPSFMATREEKDSTRARANILREFLSKDKTNIWDHREVYDILDLCLSCKGCKGECPSGVDMAKLKAEYLQHWYDRYGIPLRTRIFAHISTINKAGSVITPLFNFIIKNRVSSRIIKKIAGIAQSRSIPLLYKVSLRKWIRRTRKMINTGAAGRQVCLFIDEFTNYNDVQTGIAAIRLLNALGYKVITTDHEESARTFISKGLIRKAKKIIRKNILLFSGLISNDLPLLGIEPSAILGFRDEYPELAGPDLKNKARELSANCFLIDEFISSEFKAGRIKSESFSDVKVDILLHAHCQQKAISSSESTINMLSIPVNYSVREIPSGCCGMAGSFGYEKEHFELSNKIGELVLFPEIRKNGDHVIIAAPGTSCRHHIKDGTGKTALHPVQILYKALRKAEE